MLLLQVWFFTEISEASHHKVHHHLLLASNIERLFFFFFLIFQRPEVFPLLTCSQIMFHHVSVCHLQTSQCDCPNARPGCQSSACGEVTLDFDSISIFSPHDAHRERISSCSHFHASCWQCKKLKYVSTGIQQLLCHQGPPGVRDASAQKC